MHIPAQMSSKTFPRFFNAAFKKGILVNYPEP
jgi:hypothetical protein